MQLPTAEEGFFFRRGWALSKDVDVFKGAIVRPQMSSHQSNNLYASNCVKY